MILVTGASGTNGIETHQAAFTGWRESPKIYARW